MKSASVKKLIRVSGGIKLDLGCGENKQLGFLGMDKRKTPVVDIVHDVEIFPWPIPDEVCHTVLMSHLWEHIEPRNRIDVMNEIWRIMKVEGQLLIACPYSTSFGAYQDPTHYPCPNEATFTYFDPSKPLWGIYKSKPWKLLKNSWLPNGNMEIVLEKLNAVP